MLLHVDSLTNSLFLSNNRILKFQGMRARKSEIAQAIAPYEATSSEQLTLARGTLIMIRKKTESGWWEGEIHAKGRKRQIGWFPASYVKILQGGRNSGRNTPVSGSRIEMTETILGELVNFRNRNLFLIIKFGKRIKRTDCLQRLLHFLDQQQGFGTLVSIFYDFIICIYR